MSSTVESVHITQTSYCYEYVNKVQGKTNDIAKGGHSRACACMNSIEKAVVYC